MRRHKLKSGKIQISLSVAEEPEDPFDGWFGRERIDHAVIFHRWLEDVCNIVFPEKGTYTGTANWYVKRYPEALFEWQTYERVVNGGNYAA